MLLWLQNNIATLIISILLLISVISVIIHIIKEKRAGKSSCGCSCGGCQMAGKCHK